MHIYIPNIYAYIRMLIRILNIHILSTLDKKCDTALKLVLLTNFCTFRTIYSTTPYFSV